MNKIILSEYEHVRDGLKVVGNIDATNTNIAPTWTNRPNALKPVESQQLQTNSAVQFINVSDEIAPARRTYNPSTSAAGDTSAIASKGRLVLVNGALPAVQGQTTTYPSELFSQRNMTYNENSIALSSDRGTLELSGVNLMYEGTRVKSWLVGRDLNPGGRGDGSHYALGDFSIGNIRPVPTTTPVGGWGNSVNNWCGTIGGRNGCGSIPPPDGGYSGSGDGTEIARITEDELSMIVGCSLREHHSPNICTDWEVGECEEYDPIITGNEGDKLVLVADCYWHPDNQKEVKECNDYLRKVMDRWTALGRKYTYTVPGGGITEEGKGPEGNCYGASAASCAVGPWYRPRVRGVVVVFVKNKPECPGGGSGTGGGGGPSVDLECVKDCEIDLTCCLAEFLCPGKSMIKIHNADGYCECCPVTTVPAEPHKPSGFDSLCVDPISLYNPVLDTHIKFQVDACYETYRECLDACQK